MGKEETGSNGIELTGNALPYSTGHKKANEQPLILLREEQVMSEENIKKFFETIARIISEREQVRVTVQVSKKEAA